MSRPQEMKRIGDSTSYSEFPLAFMADWRKREKEVLSPILFDFHQAGESEDLDVVDHMLEARFPR